MRPLVAYACLAAALLGGAASATVAQAATPSVASIEVTVGPDLAAKADKLGQREFDYLAAELKRTVERRLAREGGLAPDGGRLNLVIEDATPSRPTSQQLFAKPGLSMLSFGLGGARISGEYVAADGERSPIRYSWYETEIRQAPFNITWSDASTAFSRLARRLGDGRFVEN